MDHSVNEVSNCVIIEYPARTSKKAWSRRYVPLTNPSWRSTQMLLSSNKQFAKLSDPGARALAASSGQRLEVQDAGPLDHIILERKDRAWLFEELPVDALQNWHTANRTIARIGCGCIPSLGTVKPT